MMRPLRWLLQNLGTLLLAFILAVVVWVSAVVTADPNEERSFIRQVNLVGQSANLALEGDVPEQARITLKAPRSILSKIANNPNLVQAWMDLTGLGAGEHQIPVMVKWDINPVRLVLLDPSEAQFILEPIITRMVPVDLNINGDPPLGYKKGTPVYNPAQVSVSGPQSQVDRVALVRAELDISGANEIVHKTVPVLPVDEKGSLVSELSLSPKAVNVTQPIALLGGYKNVVVKVLTRGQVAEGYRLTNISVTPPNVTIFAQDPARVNDVPGYIESQTVDLAGLADDQDYRVNLKLPVGVTLVGEQSVLVQVGVAAIEGSLTVSIPVEPVGLPPEMKAIVSPSMLDVIVSGPLPVLETLKPASFRAVVDLSGMSPGQYQIKPIIDLAPDAVSIKNTIPDTVMVEIQVIPSPTPTFQPEATTSVLPGTGTAPASTPQPAPMLTPTPTR